jgi:co-chaperonin GroES (HSP10)
MVGTGVGDLVDCPVGRPASNMRPIKDRVIVRLDNNWERERISDGGIVVPADVKMGKGFQEPLFGWVESKGPDCKDPQISEGDYVLLGRFAGLYLNPADNEDQEDQMLVCKEWEILAVVEQ